MQSETLRNIRKTVSDSPTTKEVSMTRTGQQYLNLGLTPAKENSPETVNRRTHTLSIYGGGANADRQSEKQATGSLRITKASVPDTDS